MDAFEFDVDDTFTYTEADMVTREYVCAVCHADLTVLDQPGDRRVLIVCLEHGSVTRVGRVMRSSVGIQMEKEKMIYRYAIHALPDLWGELIPPKKTEKELLKSLGF